MATKRFFYYMMTLWLLGILPAKAQVEHSNLVITDGIYSVKLKKTIEKNVSAFLYACNSAVIKGKEPKLSKKATTEDARTRFAAIWETSPMGCSIETLERICLRRPAGGYQIRNIPVTMYDAPENEQNQEIVLNLTYDGRIDDIFIPVMQYSDILSAGTEDIDHRVMVLDFLENFRTAYNRKDIGFIETVFSDNAIIIVGKEIMQKPNSDEALRSLSRAQFEYQVKNKTQYISALKEVFRKNKYINVTFDEYRVIQHEAYPQVYGVTMKQVWDSSTLKDETGYLFLLIDFRDEAHPLIHVRTWQPTMYAGRQLRRDEIFQIGDFDLR
jgi:hypothetical protein